MGYMGAVVDDDEQIYVDSGAVTWERWQTMARRSVRIVGESHWGGGRASR